MKLKTKIIIIIKSSGRVHQGPLKFSNYSVKDLTIVQPFLLFIVAVASTAIDV